MQNIFYEVNSLDKRCYEEFSMSEDILMENAAHGMANFIKERFENGSKVLIVCGGGNNGGDGIALSRILHRDYEVVLYLAQQPKSSISLLQLKRATSIGVKIVDELESSDILVDALFGSGLNRPLDEESKTIIKNMNSATAYKIACDIPSGIKSDSTLCVTVFKADATLTMGALKLSLFSDHAKDFIGEIRVVDLGISREMYEIESHTKLLDIGDLELPFREKKSTHKGDFGHLSVVCGEKVGASVIAGSAALRFGAGLVTLLSNEHVQIPYELMSSHTLPKNTTAIALGMGLGAEFSTAELESFLDHDLPLILDADIFSHEMIATLLDRKNVVVTPHPKEFVTLLKRVNLADISVEELQLMRFKYTQLFSKKYPHVVLVLKGANVIISHEDTIFVNPHGTSALAKGGSGDVLSGLIGVLLAQGKTPLHSAINGSLAHTLSALKFEKNSYSLTPFDLIDNLKGL